jgi:hypothetical protein
MEPEQDPQVQFDLHVIEPWQPHPAEQPEQHDVTFPGEHTPWPVHVPCVHWQELLQVSVRVPQLPQATVCVAPGTQTPVHPAVQVPLVQVLPAAQDWQAPPPAPQAVLLGVVQTPFRQQPFGHVLGPQLDWHVPLVQV